MPSTKTDWAVQIGAFRTSRAAHDLMEGAVAKLGAMATVETADLGEQGVWFRVRLFAGSDRRQAELFRATVEEQLGISGSLLIGSDTVSGPFTAAKVTTPRPPESTARSARWALQLASRTTAGAAGEEASHWESRLGRPVVVVPAEVEGLGTRYRVYAVGFPTVAEAREQRQELAASGVATLGPLDLPE